MLVVLDNAARRRAGPAAAARRAGLPGAGDQPRPADRPGRRRGRAAGRRWTCSPPTRPATCSPGCSAPSGSAAEPDAVGELAAAVRVPAAGAADRGRQPAATRQTLAAYAGRAAATATGSTRCGRRRRAGRRAGARSPVLRRPDPHRRSGCSGCSACTRARTSPCRPRPASPPSTSTGAAAAGRAGRGAPARRARPRPVHLPRPAARLRHRTRPHHRHRRAAPRRHRTGCSTTTCTPRTPPTLLLNPTRDPITLTRAPARRHPGTPHRPCSRPWPGSPPNMPVLLAAVDHAAATGFDTHTWQLAWTLDDFLDRRGHWHDQAATEQRRGGRRRPAGRPDRPGPRPPPPRRRLHPAGPLRRRPHPAAATPSTCTARPATRPGRPTPTTASALVWERQGRHAEALDHARQALDLYRAAGHRRGQANALNAVGWYHALLGDHQQALTYCQQALTLLQELGDRHGQADTWDSLGYAHHHLGHHTQAITCYQHALDLFRDLGDRYDEADHPHPPRRHPPRRRQPHRRPRRLATGPDHPRPTSTTPTPTPSAPNSPPQPP